MTKRAPELLDPRLSLSLSRPIQLPLKAERLINGALLASCHCLSARAYWRAEIESSALLLEGPSFAQVSLNVAQRARSCVKVPV